jgi:superfamily II DNA helicase RecQ
MDAVQVAGRFGIKANRAVRYEHDEVGTRLNYEVMSKAVSFARCAPSAADMECALDEEELLAISGVGRHKLEKYGAAFLEALSDGGV